MCWQGWGREVSEVELLHGEAKWKAEQHKDLLKDGRGSNLGKGTVPVGGLEAAPGKR